MYKEYLHGGVDLSLVVVVLNICVPFRGLEAYRAQLVCLEKLAKE